MAAQFAHDALWPQEWMEAAGEATIRSRASPKSVKLYCGWFCPFAQRAWIACEAKGIDYQYIEINPYEVDEHKPGGYTKRALPLEVKRSRYPDFVASSPRGLVPSMNASGELVWDSLQLVEYIDERFSGPPLLPHDDPLARAQVRIWIAHCDNQIQKQYYTMLMEQETNRQEEAKAKMFQAIHELADAMSTDGPFFLGVRFSYFEIAVAPFWQRYLWVGQHYRDLTFPDDAAFRRMQKWWAAVEEHPAVAATLVCRDRLVASYSDYALNKGTSEYARNLQSSLSSASHQQQEAQPPRARL